MSQEAYCIACRAAMSAIAEREGWWTCYNAVCSAYSTPRPEALTSATPARRASKPSAASQSLLTPTPWRQVTRASKRPPIIVINGYAGSLVIAATSIDCDVVGSYEHEDRADGLRVQRINFPTLSYASTRRRWPDDDLAGVVVIAHPPCAAFSSQNRTADRGTDASTFARTVDTLEYALGHRADAVLLESVVGALDGARSVHDEYARRHGYRLYRVLQDAVTFGVPQHRERFWAVFVRDGVAPGSTWFRHTPRRCAIEDVLEKPPGLTIAAVAARVARQHKVMADALGSTDAERVLKGVVGFGAIRRPLATALGRRLTTDEERWLCLSAFRKEQVNVLDPKGVACVLMHNSVWVCNGRALSAVEYKRVMGFPDHYRFPVDDWRRLISKGVCPPVAEWLLDQVLSWIEGVTPPHDATWLEPDGILDLRPGYSGAIP